MSYYKSIVKTALFAGVFFSNSLLANQFLVSDQKEIDYSLNESHLIYGFEPDDKKSTSLEIKTTMENQFDRILKPLYKDEKVLFRLSAQGIRGQQKDASSISESVISLNEHMGAETDSYISFVMKVRF